MKCGNCGGETNKARCTYCGHALTVSDLVDAQNRIKELEEEVRRLREGNEQWRAYCADRDAKWRAKCARLEAAQRSRPADRCPDCDGDDCPGDCWLERYSDIENIREDERREMRENIAEGIRLAFHS